MYLTFYNTISFAGSEALLIYWTEKVEPEGAVILPVVCSAYVRCAMLEPFACSETLGIDWTVYTSAIRVRVPVLANTQGYDSIHILFGFCLHGPSSLMEFHELGWDGSKTNHTILVSSTICYN